MRDIYLLLGGFVLTDFFCVRSRPERSHLLLNDDMTDRIAQRKFKPAESMGFGPWVIRDRNKRVYVHTHISDSELQRRV